MFQKHLHAHFFALSKVVPGTSMSSPARIKTRQLMRHGKWAAAGHLKACQVGVIDRTTRNFRPAGAASGQSLHRHIYTGPWVPDPCHSKCKQHLKHKVRTRTHSRWGVGSNSCMSASPLRFSSALFSCPLPSAPAARGPQSNPEQLIRRLHHLNIGPCNLSNDTNEVCGPATLYLFLELPFCADYLEPMNKVSGFECGTACRKGAVNKQRYSAVS